MDFWYQAGGQTRQVQVEAEGDGYRVRLGDRSYRVRARLTGSGALAFELEDGRRCLAYAAADGSRRWVAMAGGAASGQAWLLSVPEAAGPRRHAAASGPAALEAQMPGIVRRVLAAEGQSVARGQVLLLMEAMKMEIRVTAPEVGVVARVAVTAGQAVERGQILIELAAAPAQSSTPMS